MKQPERFGEESEGRKAGEGRALKPVTLITDGACIGNPGPGGWRASCDTISTRKSFTARSRAPPTTAWS
jgi:hypothetical protein